MSQKSAVLPADLVYISDACQKDILSQRTRLDSSAWKQFGGVKALIVLQGGMFLECGTKQAYETCPKSSSSCSAFEKICQLPTIFQKHR